MTLTGATEIDSDEKGSRTFTWEGLGRAAGRIFLHPHRHKHKAMRAHVCVLCFIFLPFKCFPCGIKRNTRSPLSHHPPHLMGGAAYFVILRRRTENTHTGPRFGTLLGRGSLGLNNTTQHTGKSHETGFHHHQLKSTPTWWRTENAMEFASGGEIVNRQQIFGSFLFVVGRYGTRR